MTGRRMITGEIYSLESGCWKAISRRREHALERRLPESNEVERCVIVERFAAGRVYHSIHHLVCVMIYLLLLSKHLLSYLIFGAYLILSLGSATPQSLHIATQSHSVDVYFVLGQLIIRIFT